MQKNDRIYWEYNEKLSYFLYFFTFLRNQHNEKIPHFNERLIPLFI